ncbi:MAG: hypothetical protein GWN14_15725, partial [candidate division Zixibacteria bacterium]|nr:hypothetical protein [Gammaproteobacteria bacterium]NIX57329.1 hypothetical protein [candidate division Zixibacteria bacterium]
ILILFFLATTSMLAQSGKKGAIHQIQTIYDIAYMDVNNIDLPLENDASTGDFGNAYYPNGTNLSFLFSGGLATTGLVNGDLRASWMAPVLLTEEWQPGIWGMNPRDSLAQFYEVFADDGPGSPAFVEWADAVALGADFIDVNGDGLYDPNVDR